jgi:hypothetical protein
MEHKNKLSDIAGKITPVEEDQQGKLVGGFASFASNTSLSQVVTNTNNASSCSCSGSGTNTNNASSCSCSTAA